MKFKVTLENDEGELLELTDIPGCTPEHAMEVAEMGMNEDTDNTWKAITAEEDRHALCCNVMHIGNDLPCNCHMSTRESD